MQDDAGGPGLVLRDASRNLRRILVANGDVERRLGLHLRVNSTDLAIMQLLMQRGALTPSEIASGVGVTTAAVTVAIDRLLKAGHVDRKRHPSDRRKLLITATAHSRERAMKQLMPMILGTDRLLDEFAPDQQRAIALYLERTAELMEAALGDATDDPAEETLHGKAGGRS